MKYINNRAQREDEKNGVIVLVIMFTPRVMSIKMFKMTQFLYIQLDDKKNYSQSGKNI